MRILVTGSSGFIGKNICAGLSGLAHFEVTVFNRGESASSLKAKLANCDAVVHLAGENRPRDEIEFERGNAQLTRQICQEILKSDHEMLLVYASSRHADPDSGSNSHLNAYSQSKRAAEIAIQDMVDAGKRRATIFRLPGVFGKWCKPNYNSVVATFCFNVANDLPLTINDSGDDFPLVYVDDVVSAFHHALEASEKGLSWGEVRPQYWSSPRKIAERLKSFHASRGELVLQMLEDDFARVLYLTYLSYLPPAQFIHGSSNKEADFAPTSTKPAIGELTEICIAPGETFDATSRAGQVTRVLVGAGAAEVTYEHILDGTQHVFPLDHQESNLVDLIPGWSCKIKNVGDEDLMQFVWLSKPAGKQKQSKRSDGE